MVDVAAGRGFLQGLESGQRMYARQQDIEWGKKRRARQEEDWEYRDEQRARDREWQDKTRSRQESEWQETDELRQQKDLLKFYRAVRHLQAGDPTLAKDPEHLESIANVAFGGQRPGTQLTGMSPGPDGKSVAFDLSVTPKDGGEPYASYVTQQRLDRGDPGYDEDKPYIVPLEDLFSTTFRVGRALEQSGAGELVAAIDQESDRAGQTFLQSEGLASSLPEQAASMSPQQLDSMILANGGEVAAPAERYTTYTDEAGNLLQRSDQTGKTSVVLKASEARGKDFAPTELEKLTDFYMRENGGDKSYRREDARREAKAFIYMENYPDELEAARDILIEENKSKFGDEKLTPQQIESQAYQMADRSMNQLGLTPRDLQRFRSEAPAPAPAPQQNGKSAPRGDGEAGGNGSDLSTNGLLVYRSILKRIQDSGKSYNDLDASQRKGLREYVSKRLGATETNLLMQKVKNL